MQERINQLALAALNAPPPPASFPKPATFTPAVDQPPQLDHQPSDAPMEMKVEDPEVPLPFLSS